MTSRIAIVGDVHGNVIALRSILSRVTDHADATVFVGDYVNRGPASAEVIETLIDASANGSVTCLAGNHDRALLEVLEGADLGQLLHMGGAPTILSYLDPVVGDVAPQFRAAVPEAHRRFLASLEERFIAGRLVVTHGPESSADPDRFHVYGHVVQRSLVPKLSGQSAAIDTGCGTLPGGRLTALFWPDLEVLQVDPLGAVMARPGAMGPR